MATLRKSNLPYAGFLFLSAAQAKIMAPGQDTSWVRRPDGVSIYALLPKAKRHLMDHGDDPRQILTQARLRPGVQADAEVVGRTAGARAAC